MSYAISAISPKLTERTIIKDVIAIDCLSNALFPAKTPNEKSPEEYWDIPDRDSFDMTLLWDRRVTAERRYETDELFGDNKTRLSVTRFVPLPEIGQAFGVRGTVIVFKFQEEHLQTSLLTLESLKPAIIQIGNSLGGSIRLRHGRISRYRRNLASYRGPRIHHPKEIGWISYFGSELVDFLGCERFDRLHTCAEKKYLQDGSILLVLQEAPFDADNSEHRTREIQAMKELGFPDLQ
jgi:hypothetical protein